MELYKEGMSGRAIAKLFGMTQDTVAKTIAKVTENAESAKSVTDLLDKVVKNPESGKMATPESSPSVLPLAIEKPPLRYAFYTEDRPETLSGVFEIPEGQYEVLICESMDEVIMLSMRANAAHGNKNTVEDRVLMVNKLIQMDEQRFMSNPFAVNIPEVMAALQITRHQARLVIEPKNAELKERRDAAIMELHEGGKSNNAIGKTLGIPSTTVDNVVKALPKKAETAKLGTPSSPAVLPLANTEYRPETRVDADEFVDDFLSEYDDYISLAE